MLRTDITILQKSNENMKNETRQVETVSVEAMTRISSLETKLADAESSLAQKEAERAEMSEKLTHSWRAERDRCDELDLCVHELGCVFAREELTRPLVVQIARSHLGAQIGPRTAVQLDSLRARRRVCSYSPTRRRGTELRLDGRLEGRVDFVRSSSACTDSPGSS